MQKEKEYINEDVKQAHEELQAKLKDPAEKNKLKKHLQEIKSGETRLEMVYSQSPYKFALPNGSDFDFKRYIETLKAVRRKIRILDVGAGKGHFLALLKKDFGKKIHTTALDIYEHPELNEKYKEGLIDEVIYESAELFLPKQAYDIIVSNLGGLKYSIMPELVIRKLSHSLRSGGILLIYPLLKIPKEIAKDKRFKTLKLQDAIAIKKEE
ncbi:MAG: class I SAM-dependent methyltransferase [Candidatus ainarchaeum sp.]|nr:class I SAM-dependent methyltransferase [Candidatus ainarchaeum sp.]